MKDEIMDDDLETNISQNFMDGEPPTIWNQIELFLCMGPPPSQRHLRAAHEPVPARSRVDGVTHSPSHSYTSRSFAYTFCSPPSSSLLHTQYSFGMQNKCLISAYEVSFAGLVEAIDELPEGKVTQVLGNVRLCIIVIMSTLSMVAEAMEVLHAEIQALQRQGYLYQTWSGWQEFLVKTVKNTHWVMRYQCTHSDERWRHVVEPEPVLDIFSLLKESESKAWLTNCTASASLLPFGEDRVYLGALVTDFARFTLAAEQIGEKGASALVVRQTLQDTAAILRVHLGYPGVAVDCSLFNLRVHHHLHIPLATSGPPSSADWPVDLKSNYCITRDARHLTLNGQRDLQSISSGGGSCKPSVTRSLTSPTSCVYKGVRAYPPAVCVPHTLDPISLSPSKRHHITAELYTIFLLLTLNNAGCRAIGG
ncbi:unnamed protein product [Timema podura]|uniref:Uncharacterized protein n=1 Tax=Timema podura TaxID=61482 RepID=A0ABN7NIC5_TIMPD|nr:unnamed protein product [Timema podura]